MEVLANMDDYAKIAQSHQLKTRQPFFSKCISILNIKYKSISFCMPILLTFKLPNSYLDIR